MWKKRPRSFLILLVLGLFPAVAFSSEPVGTIPLNIDEKALGVDLGREDWDADAPVDIQSNKMSVDFQSREIVFLGDVRVRQADFVLSAREVTAVFGSHAEDIQRIMANGDVSIRKADKVAWGEEAVYDRAKATILLYGNPRLQQGNNFIQGEKIRVFLEEDRMDVEGDVTAEFLLKAKQ